MNGRMELWIREGNGAALLLSHAFVVILAAAAVHDIRTKKIPDRYSMAVALLALGSFFCVPEISIASRCAGALCISVPMLLLAGVRPGAFGGGDIKLMAAGGLFLGIKAAVLSAFLAFFFGGVLCMALLFTKQKNRAEAIVFGPFLCLGMTIALLFGGRIWGWILL